jgi:hypothetical protein
MVEHVLATAPMHVYEVRPRRDHRGVDPVSIDKALSFTGP